jgi:hypothetical protein
MASWNDIQRGDRVTFVDRFGQKRTGKAVMRGPNGWVLDMGGKHGTPAVPNPDTIIKVAKGRNRKPDGFADLLYGKEIN